ncbi:MAG: protein TonB [Arenicella sp.]|jgi:protein TonB
MRSTLFILLLLFCTTSDAQKIKEIIEDDYDLFCRNIYDVLKKDKTVKHGSYKSTYVSGNPRIKGWYTFNQKDSLWTYFNSNKPIIAARGKYKYDVKLGVWDYFDSKEQLRHRYNHSTGVLNFTTFEDTVKKRTIIINDSVFTDKVSRPPIFLLGDKEKLRIIRNNIVYPQSAIDQNIFGTVMISFYINKYGKAIDHKITSSVGGGCDEEALRVVKLIPNEWVPGIYKNALHKMVITIPITFMLN